VRPGQPDQEFKIVNNTRITRPRGDYVPPDEPFERSGTIFQNNQIRDVVKKLRRKNILQISLCEVYHDGLTNNREYSPFTMEVKVLYRNISRELIDNTLEDRINRARQLPAPRVLFPEYEEEPNQRNPNQLRVVQTPNNTPPIGSASYPDVCVICQEPVVGEGCRVNCPAGHIYHCECINTWRNTRATNTYYNTHWQDGCPYCRAPISQMYLVNIPEGFTTGFGRRRSNFGKRIKRRGNNTKMSLKTIDSLIKLVQKL
jgi:hypothetical protein